jgi:Zn-dependent M28 family amino/carboxypeptidase
MPLHVLYRTALSSVLAFTLLPAGSAAQPLPAGPAPPPIYDSGSIAALTAIVKAAGASTYAYDRDEFLSDAIGPRLSGSPQADAAVHYVAAQLTALGLDVHLEPVTVAHWVRGEESAALVDWPGRMADTTQKIVLTALGMSVATPADGLTAPVVVVKDFDQLAALGASVRGKIVLFDVHFDKRLEAAGGGGEAYGELIGYRIGGPSVASKLGAVATLVRSLGGADYRLPHTGTTAYFGGAKPIPAAAISAEDADLIARLAQRGPVSMHLTLTPRRLADVKTANVIADLTGSTYPQQVVILSGHLDSWDLGTGATDDGAGVAQAMGAMAVYHELGLRPRRTIRCIAWMNEENGTAGGNQYALDERDHLADTVAAIETDSGADRPLGFGTSLSSASGPFLDPISAALVANGSPRISFGLGSEVDVGPIVKLGVPAYAPVQDSPTYFDYHHTAADTFDKVDPAGMAANTAVVAALAFGLADALRLPEREPYHER